MCVLQEQQVCCFNLDDLRPEIAFPSPWPVLFLELDGAHVLIFSRQYGCTAAFARDCRENCKTDMLSLLISSCLLEFFPMTSTEQDDAPL